MKKLLAIIIALLPIMAAAQKFYLTPYGLLNEENNSKYIVIPMEGTKAELYAKAKTAVTSLWTSAKDVMSYNEPDIIVVNGYSASAAHFKKMGMQQALEMSYRIEIKFKDGKIRVDAPQITDLHYNKVTWSIEMGGGGSFGGDVHIFDKNGKCRYDDLKKNMEDYFNGLVTSLTTSMTGGSSDDDW